MEHGSSYEEALAEAQRLGYAEADPTEDVSGKDAAAKMAILATVAFGSRVTLEDVSYVGLERVAAKDVAAAREMGMAIRLVGAATLVGDRWDVRVGPALVDRGHPLAAVEGAFNAVMLQGDAIREITLEGPGAGGIETASAVVADMVTVVGTTGTGFLQNDACWRSLERLPEGDVASPFYVRVEVADLPGVLALVALRLAAHGVSVARLVQEQGDGSATLHIVTHEAPAGRLRDALEEIDGLDETRAAASALPVVSDRGVAELGWA
jgi:homoserine dehydrogenase